RGAPLDVNSSCAGGAGEDPRAGTERRPDAEEWRPEHHRDRRNGGRERQLQGKIHDDQQQDDADNFCGSLGCEIEPVALELIAEGVERQGAEVNQRELSEAEVGEGGLVFDGGEAEVRKEAQSDGGSDGDDKSQELEVQVAEAVTHQALWVPVRI